MDAAVKNTMREDLVSIITPCYNSERYIAETIESVVSQTFQSWEMIIVDDGSGDETAEIVNRFAGRDPRIQYISQQNSGSAAARNNGIRRAEGRYIALLDSDDLWLPEFLERQLRFMKEKDAAVVFCSYSRIGEKSEDILRPEYAKETVAVKDMQTMNYIGCLSGLYDTKRYGKVFLREELKSVRDDYAYWYDIVALAGMAYGNPEILAKYRVLAGSTTGNKRKLIKKQYQFYRNYLRLGAARSIRNTLLWGMSGLRKFGVLPGPDRRLWPHSEDMSQRGGR